MEDRMTRKNPVTAASFGLTGLAEDAPIRPSIPNMDKRANNARYSVEQPISACVGAAKNEVNSHGQSVAAVCV